MNKVKIAFVDFDETLINLNICNTYLIILKNLPLKLNNILKLIILILMIPLFVSYSLINKKKVYKLFLKILLYKMNKDTIKKIIDEKIIKVLIKNINKKVLNEINDKIVYIISGNLKIVIEPISKKFNFKTIGVDYNHNDNFKFTHFPIYKEKQNYVNKIINYYKNKNIPIETFGYGNSYNDYYMLKNLDNIYLVNPSKKLKDKFKNYTNVTVI